MAKKEISNKYTLPLIGFLFGTIAIKATGSFWYCLVFAASFIPLVQDIILQARKTADAEKVTAVMEAAGLTKKLGDDILKPKELWRQETETGFRAGYSLPKGLSSEDFRKREQAISEALGAEVKFSYEKKGQVMMEVSTVKLKSLYKFAPTKFDNPATLPAGHSKTGFQAISFGEGISSLLVGAQSRAGKSSFLRQAITNLIVTTDPAVIRLHLCDLKYGAEFGIFSGCSHVQSYAERINQVAETVEWLRYEAERRFRLFRKFGVFKIGSYNEATGEPLPFHFLLVDELASVAREKDILEGLVDLSRLSGAAGIYCVFSTQNPTVDVVPSHLKANCQARMAFRVSSGVNSMVILDRYGAEELECQGRAILKTDDFYEVQVPFLDEKECKRLIKPFQGGRKAGAEVEAGQEDQGPEGQSRQGHNKKEEALEISSATYLPKGVISLADWQRFKNRRVD